MLTAKILLEMNFSGKKVGEILKMSKEWTPAQLSEFLLNKKIPEIEFERMESGSIWEFLCTDFFPPASKSEKFRWLRDKAVIVNGIAFAPNDPVPDLITSLVLFPKSSLKITML